MVSQAFFENRMYDNAVLWLRVAYTALARCDANLHAQFADGELRTLMRTDTDQLSRAIRRAKAEGYLNEDLSDCRCLVLSDKYFGSKLPGSEKPCSTCTGKVSRPRRVPAKSLPVASPDKSLRERE